MNNGWGKTVGEQLHDFAVQEAVSEYRWRFVRRWLMVAAVMALIVIAWKM